MDFIANLANLLLLLNAQRKPLYLLLTIVFLLSVGLLLSLIISLTTPISAQISPPSSDNATEIQSMQSAATPQPTDTQQPTIEITSHQDGDEIQVGELTIQGISSDDEENNCQVYADVNDVKPLQNATAAGIGGKNDFSRWTFTYTQDYQLIEEGVNELTSKISCFSSESPTATPLSKWHSVNVTGVKSSIAGGGQEKGQQPQPLLPNPIPLPTASSEHDLQDKGAAAVDALPDSDIDSEVYDTFFGKDPFFKDEE
jgi:hypothetical protein